MEGERNMSEQEILEASCRLFAKYGYDNVSVRKIASEADANIGSISYYFHNKIGILNRLIEKFYVGLTENLYPILDGQIINKVEGLRSLSQATIEYMYANMDCSKVVLREITFENERFEELVKPYYINFNNKIIAYFERLGLNHSRRAAIKYMALSRYVFYHTNIVELYYQKSFNEGLFEDYVEMVLSSFTTELSA